MFFALANLDSAAGPLPALFVEDRYYALNDVVPGLVKDASKGLLDVLDQWDVAEPALASAVAEGVGKKAQPVPEADTRRFLPLVVYPSKILCTGINYDDHLIYDGGIKDYDRTKFKNTYDMMFFMKLPRAVIGSGQTVRYPSQSAQFDWEVELVVVMGKQGRRVAEEDAMSLVAGYAVGIDLTSRDWQINSRHFKQLDLLVGKSFDDSAPIGPHLVPARFVDPTDLSLKLRVNGKTMQDSHTREMIWSVPEQVAALSQHMTWEPGDLLYTGAPAGIGLTTNTFLKVGDQVEAEITGLGTLRISVAPDPDAQAACAPAKALVRDRS